MTAEAPSGSTDAALAGLGWDDRWQEQARSHDGRPGRVTRTHRVGFDVLTDRGTEFAVTKARIRDPLLAPATGDWVIVDDVTDIDEPVITTVLERRTAMVRRDPADAAAPQVLAANADVVAVVHGADRPVSPRRLERQLAVAHGSGSAVVIVVTKADLDPDGECADAISQHAGDTPVLITAAAVQPQGITDVDALTESNHTLVLLGESGAGKSSLVNAVLGYEALAIGGVREGDAKGRHTTTRRTLLPLPTGGALLDTPGVRAVGLWPDFSDLDAVFPQIADAAEQCRFADCAHRREPGCGVIAACEEGRVDEDRLASWRQLDGELAATAEEVQRKGWR